MVAKAKIRHHTTRHDTTMTTFTKSVNGAKELKKYIQEITNLIEYEFYRELHSDLTQPSANVAFNPIGRPGQNELARECVASHKQLVCELIGSSSHTAGGGCALTEHEARIRECLDKLEELRKMLVNAKQTKNTNIGRIKVELLNLLKSLPPSVFEEFGGGFVEVSSPEDNPDVVNLRELIGKQKEEYKTQRHQILKQVNDILAAVRNRHILAFKTEAETLVGRVIHHAEQCRAFIRTCREHALLEFAASEWWRATYYCWAQAQEMEMGDDAAEVTTEYKFHITPLPLSKWPRMTIITYIESESESESPAAQFIVTTTTTTTTTANSRIEEKEVARYDVTKEFEDRILTPEAIRGFEWEEAQMWYYTQQQAHDAAQNADAMES